METASSAGHTMLLLLPALTRLSLLPFQPNEAKEDEDKGTKELSKEEVKARIQQYNSQVSENGMNLVSFLNCCERIVQSAVFDVTNGAQYSRLLIHPISVFRWNLHRLHQGQPAPQSACHGLCCRVARL